MFSKETIQRLNDINIEQVAEALKMQVSHHKTLCPFHTDSRPSLTFHLGTNRYRCFVCGAHGGTIDLVMNTQHWPFLQACQWLQKGLKSELLTTQPKRQPAPSKPDIDLPHLEKLVRYPLLCAAAKQFLFHERKIHPQVVQALGISSIATDMPMSHDCRKGWFRGPALLIPYRDIHGKLVSVQARYLGPSPNGTNHPPLRGNEGVPRFQFPKGSRCHIFNLPILKQLQPGEPLFITEGVTDCMALMSAGYKAIAIPSATLLKEEDLKPLSPLIHNSKFKIHNPPPLTLHMFPDQDEPGEHLFLQLRKFFPTLVRHQLPPGIKDVGELWRLRVLSAKC